VLPTRCPLASCRYLSKMRALAQLLYIIGLAFAVNVNANVEKTIFLGPGPVLLPYKRVLPDPLSIETLAPANLSVLATKLPVQLPSDLAPRGIEHWYLLRGLEEGRRYEVRICWPAFVSDRLSAHVLLLHFKCIDHVFVCLSQHANCTSATHRLLAGYLRAGPRTQYPGTSHIAYTVATLEAARASH